MDVTVKSMEGDQIKTVTRRGKGRETAHGRKRVTKRTSQRADRVRWK